MSKKETSKKKNLFTLKDVNTDQVDLRFGIPLLTDLIEIPLPINITKINELHNEKTRTVSFLDGDRKVKRCKVSMIDFSSKKTPSTLPYNCFWDKHPLPKECTPIGCPIRYVSCSVTKTYVSAISKDTYTIKEKVTKKKALQIASVENDKMIVAFQPYYETDGVFCSFDCLMAYIEEFKHLPIYSDSQMLAVKMYNDLFETTAVDINVAGHWRTLSEYGGWLSVEKFRDSFEKAIYKSHGTVTNLPVYQPVGVAYEKMIKF